MITLTQVTRNRVNTVWRCTITLAAALLLISDAQAVSRAGGLFLRIPVGARATAMGESNIAVADDATATHWNPAGLGAPPMSGSWLTVDIPENYRPLRSFAAIKSSGMIGHQLWALSENGLIVNDGSGWRNYTLYHSEVDESIESIVRKYTQASDDSVVAHMLTIVGDLNNPRPRTSITELQAKTLAALPEQSTAREEITNGFVSLAKAYDKLTIN